MTKGLRERYAKMLSDLGECSIDDVILGAFAFFEQEIIEAERRVKDRINFIPRIALSPDNLYSKDYIEGYNQCIDDFYAHIDSLK